MVVMDTLGSRLRENRIRRGWDQKELASRVGVSHKLISSIETGKSVPSHLLFLRLSEVLGVSLDVLAFGRVVQQSTGTRTPAQISAIGLIDALTVAETRLAIKVLEAFIEVRNRHSSE